MKFPDSVLLHKELEKKNKVVRKIGDANILPHPNCTLKICMSPSRFYNCTVCFMYVQVKIIATFEENKIACFYVIPVIPQEIHFSSYWIEFV